MTDLKWEERYDGTRWFSNGVFHVVGAFENTERLGSPYLYYVVTDVDWDEGNTVGDGFKTPEEAMALAQRLQNAFDGKDELANLCSQLAQAKRVLKMILTAYRLVGGDEPNGIESDCLFYKESFGPDWPWLKEML